ncbi:hypothetical protein Bbelb_293950 [Branchiostoma belcheri]|nr:hypothetical protein Bbelb_293950 [Branchiostoma belcheri]
MTTSNVARTTATTITLGRHLYRVTHVTVVTAYVSTGMIDMSGRHVIGGSEAAVFVVVRTYIGPNNAFAFVPVSTMFTAIDAKVEDITWHNHQVPADLTDLFEDYIQIDDFERAYSRRQRQGERENDYDHIVIGDTSSHMRFSDVAQRLGADRAGSFQANSTAAFVKDIRYHHEETHLWYADSTQPSSGITVVFNMRTCVPHITKEEDIYR